VARSALAACIRHVGQLDYPVQTERLLEITEAWLAGAPARLTIGRCLLSVTRDGITIIPEARHSPAKQRSMTLTPGFDRQTQRAIDLVTAQAQ
ncbi:MAG: hypothetical protein AAFO70_07370, partial [Pseudomonadota bacterium]